MVALFRDIREDLKRRLPHYVSDWVDGFHPITLSASLFMFFTSFFPALIFGEQLMAKTGGLIGVPEVPLATGLTGCVWSLFSGQPLVIVGVTGPVTIFTTAIYGVAKSAGIDFFQFQCWIGIWSALMHWAIAITGACSAVSRVTRFSGETFAFFIAAIYIYTAANELFNFNAPKSYQNSVTDGWFGFGSFYIAITCHYARDWTFFNRTTRELIAQYGAAIAIIVWTLVASYGVFSQHDPDLLDVPQNYEWIPTAVYYPNANVSSPSGDNTTLYHNAGPYCHTEETDTGNLDFSSFCTTTRSWIVDPSSASALEVGLAIPCALLLTLLFFFDHNVSSKLSQDPAFGLVKGTAYHWDFVVLGANVLMCGLLGLPPSNGLIPQAPLHVRALATITIKDKKEVFESVREQRLSNLLQSAAMVLVMLKLEIPGTIPKGVLQGLFLYMGVTTLDGLSFWERLQMIFQETDRAPKYAFLRDDTNACRNTVIRYTLLQLLLWAVIFGCSGPWAEPYSIIFPFLIAILVPIRERLLPRVFGSEEALFIDSCGESMLAKTHPSDTELKSENELNSVYVAERT